MKNRKKEGAIFYIVLGFITILFFGKREVLKLSRMLKKNKKKVYLVFLVLFTSLLYLYWTEIVYFFTTQLGNFVFEEIPKFFSKDIPKMYNDLIDEFKENWVKIGAFIIGAKFLFFVIYNLAKRFLINTSVDRVKKSLIHSEMDELIEISARKTLVKYAKKAERLKKIPYVGVLITVLLKIFSFAGFLVFLAIALVKFGLGKLLITKVLSAQFWTGMLVFITNIPGITYLFFLYVWLWFETHIPWVPRFYYWVSENFRILLDPIWDTVVVPIQNKISDGIDVVNEKLLIPISDWFDMLEVRIIKALKRYLYFNSDKESYKRYMKLVQEHNKMQLEKKAEHDRKIEQRQQELQKRKEQTLAKIEQRKRIKEAKKRRKNRKLG